MSEEHMINREVALRDYYEHDISRDCFFYSMLFMWLFWHGVKYDSQQMVTEEWLTADASACSPVSRCRLRWPRWASPFGGLPLDTRPPMLGFFRWSTEIEAIL